ncbi:MAG: NAD kinase [Gallionellaceae bacterium]|jgi:NAD+ kinase|nr:NAD kinase [Gallionellaceae bacterium]
MKFPFRTIALIGKRQSDAIAEPLLRLAAFLSEQRIAVVVDQETAALLGAHPYQAMALEEMGGVVDLGIVLGGDGTMLNIACTLAKSGVPLVGVNQGRLGFLTDISVETMQQTIADMLAGQFVTEQRMMLSARIVRGETEICSGLALNEVVMHRDSVSSMIEFEVRINGEYLYTQRADGLIVATPTGSTAYALSSGGPILHPGLELIELVPVSPHTLSNRPIVVDSASVIDIKMLGRHASGVRVRFDSHAHFDLEIGDRLEVMRYAARLYLLHPQGHSYYHMLREKLLWNKTL